MEQIYFTYLESGPIKNLHLTAQYHRNNICQSIRLLLSSIRNGVSAPNYVLAGG